MEALIGRPVDEVPTPALVLDLDIFDANARTIATDLCAVGVDWRPHAKAHVSPVLAHRQIDLGAVGVTCATIREAGVMVAGGIDRVLVANELVTERQAATAAALQRDATVIVCVDSAIGRRRLAEAAAAAGVTIPVLLEIDIGMARAGLPVGDELMALAMAVAASPDLRLAGIMGYEGHVLDLPADTKVAACRAAIGELLRARDRLTAAGLPVDIVSCGGTGSYRISAGIPGITEIQAGGGCFNDRFYTEACGVTWLGSALTVVATVTSRPTEDRAIVDAGMKAMSWADGAPIPDLDGAAVVELFAEHGKLRLEGEARRVRVGDRIAFIPGYSDSTTMLHGGFVAVREGIVEAILPRPVRWPA